MTFKVAFTGTPAVMRESDAHDNLVLRCLQIVADEQIQLVSVGDADLVLMYPYRYPLTSTAGGGVLEAAARILDDKNLVGAESLLRRIYRIPTSTKVLAVSHENLDRRPWQAFGNLLLKTDIPRLTFWPQMVDPEGFRLPYWWNYVNWPGLPELQSEKITRFGAFYDLDILCFEQVLTEEEPRRMNKAIWLTNHLDFPREAILKMISKTIDVDVVRGVPWGGKLELLEKYQYCVSTENSTGYGYETEKVIEARIAGCIPIGYVPNPFSDFNDGAFFINPPSERVSSLPPLLKERPILDGLLDYISNAIQ